MSPVTVRVALPSDTRAIEKLLTQLDRYHVELLPDVFHTPDGPVRPKGILRAAIGEDDQDLLVAEMDGRIVGVAQVKIAERPKAPMFRPRNYAVLENMVVDAERRGAGVGKALFEAVKTWSRDRGLTHVQTICWAANEEALVFYQKAGFETVTVRLEYPIPPV
jgi:GNAT superfamily N-acetyltransferase